jgi:hypothetical protein
MRIASAWLMFLPLLAQDAREIVRQSVSKDMVNWSLVRNYTYIEKTTEQELDSHGRVKKTSSETAEIQILCGAPYRRLTEKDGKALAPKDQRRADAQMEKLGGEDSKDCAKRQATVEKRRLKEREFLQDVPDAFKFRLLGIEQIDGKEAYAIAAEPRPEYRFSGDRGRILAKIRGKIWIDKAELQWVKVDAETTDTISFGLFLFRLHKGARLQFEQARVNDEIWLPRHFHVDATGRAGLVLAGGIAADLRFENYRKFSADSRIVSTVEVK